MTEDRTQERSDPAPFYDGEADPSKSSRFVEGTRPAHDSAIWLRTDGDVCPFAFDDARRRANLHGTDFAAELLASRSIGEDALYSALAGRIGLPFEARIRPTAIVEGRSSGDSASLFINVREETGSRRLYIAPAFEDTERLLVLTQRDPALREKLVVTTRRSAAEAARRMDAAQRLADASAGLSLTRPALSAQRVVTAQQALFLVLAPSLLIAAFLWRPGPAGQILHLLASMFFFACVWIRLTATLHPETIREPIDRLGEKWSAPAPLYSVLVALRGEENMVRRLVDSLDALDWPKSRIEIFLVCEADDHATIEAVRRSIRDRPQFEIVVVPAGRPRTKPKALSFALPLARGEFLVLYDAEDQPDPLQLREAFQRFRGGPDNLACLQAPLTIRNPRQSWFSRMFAYEYGGLFGRFVPFLAAHNLPIPLGGTSNHFRRSALIAVGGWDSHNVTEDADLGLRLCRAGYGIGALTRPTREEAPTRYPVWFRQRSRWIKGWMQTVLVHSRNPVRTVRDLGWRRSAAALLIFAGMLLSCLAYPVFVAMAVWGVLTFDFTSLASDWWIALLALDIHNAFAGLLAFLLLARGTEAGARRRDRIRLPLDIVAYWLLMTGAAALALFQLFRRPHYWEKTPHAVDDPGEEERRAREMVTAA